MQSFRDSRVVDFLLVFVRSDLIIIKNKNKKGFDVIRKSVVAVV